MSDQQALEHRLRELRASFDDSFAHAASTPSTETLDVLELSVASQAFLVRVSELRSVHAGCVVKRVPTASATLLGLWSRRGVVYAVHDTAALLGAGKDPQASWLMIARQVPIAFGCAGLTRHHRLPREAWIGSAQDTRDAGGRMQAAMVDGVRLTLISVPQLIAQVTSAGTGTPATGRDEGEGTGHGR